MQIGNTVFTKFSFCWCVAAALSLLACPQARNIMLKSAGSEGRGVTAKVADFGLAVKMDHMETHLSNAFQVRRRQEQEGGDCGTS